MIIYTPIIRSLYIILIYDIKLSYINKEGSNPMIINKIGITDNSSSFQKE